MGDSFYCSAVFLVPPALFPANQAACRPHLLSFQYRRYDGRPRNWMSILEVFRGLRQEVAQRRGDTRA